ncbi:Oxygen-independent coproporphyrinogen-III oxidase [Jannaschia seosinensis]|uniref:Coproporphyrinogen-III oxidase n=1 Tax=Jannaschia seosinensis TaxID=313367 RepID=A0A0M7B658_9RHOB|nr:oxygen-independent coproporphyrinogen III oxidase [Jannaschia seosinensis]CUH12974.1 Oxygen-independent coproporphyrinogen-III oxidase [Jannaschia seosinensis]
MERIDILARHGLFDARAPRYTSYPAAPHFVPSVGPATHADWLGAIPEGGGVSLYVHIPFCRRLCWFCACRTQGTRTDAPLQPYLDALKTEIATVAAHMPQVSVRRLHLGGGTPTILSADMLRELGAALTDEFTFAPDAEVAVEIDPTMIDDDRLDALVQLGLTRASIGIQDFAPGVQAAIGREQSYEQTRIAVEGLRARDVTGLNLDLLYGLPFQTISTIERTIDQALSLGPDRIALFGYAHVPWMARRQVMIPADALPDARARFALAESATSRLRDAGLTAIGIDHFARPEDPLARAQAAGKLRRNFQGYVDDDTDVLIGLGASAISRFPQGYAQNDPATSTWKATARDGRLATIRGHAFDDDDRLRGTMIERLLCDFRIDPADIAHRAGVPEAQVRVLTDDLALRWPEAIRQGSAGEIEIALPALARLVARDLDAYAAPPERHSLAV